jgi:ribonuclease HI
MWKEATYTVAEGEALALLEAMTTMVNEGATQVVFEIDSKGIVDAIYSLHINCRSLVLLFVMLRVFCCQIETLW